MAGHDPRHDTSRTPESLVAKPGGPGDPANLGHGQPPLYATSVPDYSETGVFYEKEDTNPRSILKVGAILAATVVFSSLFALGFFKLLAGIDNRADADAAPPLWSRTPGDAAPEPRLQATIREADGVLRSPARDLDAIRTDERKTLASYGWVDKPQGTVRIPIDEAMRLFAEREAVALGAPAMAPVAAVPAPPPAVASPAPAAASPAPAAAAPSPAGGHP